MLWIKMQSIFIFLAYLAVTASASKLFSPNVSHDYSCISSRWPCTLLDVVLESEFELNHVTFPTITDPLIIESGRIPNFTRQLAEKLVGITDLAINGLQLQNLFIKPEMTHLEAKNNQIATLLVDSDKTYQMLSLDLTGNILSNVNILTRFTKLQQLTLDQNDLEQLSMDMFTNMPELRKLSLENNQLFTVSTERSLQLLKLQTLSFAGNRLIELNVEKWELDSLTVLNLSKNKLYLLNGHLGQFKSLVDVKISENYWKCEFLSEIIRLERLIFDRDESDRCKMDDLANVKQVCCTNDAFGFLGYSATGNFGLFYDKWEELRKLVETFKQFKDVTEKNQKRIGDLKEHHEISLVQRLKILEDKQKQILNKLNDREESLAVKEINEVKKVIASHKSKIDEMSRKNSNLESNLEIFVDDIDNLPLLLDDAKLDTIDNIKYKLTKWANGAIGGEMVEKGIAELWNTVKYLESQQFKYSISTIDLKKQIGTEHNRITEVQEKHTKLLGETDRLQQQMSDSETNISKILDILVEITNPET